MNVFFYSPRLTLTRGDLRVRVARLTLPSDEIRRKLEQQARDRSMAARAAVRFRIVLLAADGLQNKQIAQRLNVAARTAALWRQRFLEKGLDGLACDAPRPGRRPSITPEIAAALIAKSRQSAPSDSGHWSTRSMAREMGVSKASVSRIWRANGVKSRNVDRLQNVDGRTLYGELEDRFRSLQRINPEGSKTAPAPPQA